MERMGEIHQLHPKTMTCRCISGILTEQRYQEKRREQVIELMARRRSIRSYTDEQVGEEDIDALLQAGLLSASSRGIRPWELLVVTAKEQLQALSKAKAHGGAFLSGAPLGIVVLGIPEASDVWVEDASIVASNLLLEAESLGLGACWIQIRNRKSADGTSAETVVRQILTIPESRSVEAIIAIGHPSEEKPGYSREGLHWEKVFRERWQDTPEK